MEHSNQMREYFFTNSGIELCEVYLGPGIVLTGSARIQQEAIDRMQAVVDDQAYERKRREMEEQGAVLRAQIEALKVELSGLEEEQKIIHINEDIKKDQLIIEKRKIAVSRQADVNGDENEKS